MKNLVPSVKLTFSEIVNINEAPQITGSQDAYDISIYSWEDGEIEMRESFKVILLSRANRVKGICTISVGGVSGTVVDAKLVFAAAVTSLSSAIILVHNHPSGNLNPSQADINLTKKLVAAGKLLDVTVLDHLIITKYGYYSFGDEQMI